MKKVITLLMVTILMVICLVGCSTHANVSYTYDVDTGDKVKITMDVKDGYKMTSSLPIDFSKSDAVISQGTFGRADVYDTYMQLYNTTDDIKLLDQGVDESKGISYLFLEIKGVNTEYDYIIKINDSNTSFMLGNIVSEESAREIFNRLSFTVE